MDLAALFRLPKGMRLLTCTLQPTTLWIEAAIRRGVSACPSCHTLSARIHSYYTRTVTDVPCIDRRVVLHLHVRKFRCLNEDCPQHVFAERLPDLVRPKGRKTLRVGAYLHALGLTLGGRGGQRLASLLHIPVSGRTILRSLMREDPADVVAPSVPILGVDDFAFRRASRYGTLLMDLEQRRVVDLLPDRSQDTLAQWLQQHPEVRLMSRDRGGDYAAAARTSAPQAEQIADRFHLLVNMGEVLERYLTRHHGSLREAARALGPPEAPRRTTKRTPTDVQRRSSRRAVRLARYEQVVALAQEGVSAHQIAQEVGVSRATVYRFLTATGYPDRLSPLRPRQIDPYIPYLQDRWNTGEHNALTLWREIHAQGYPAGVAQVRRLVAGWRSPPPMPGVPGTPLSAKEEAVSYSIRQTRWLLTKAEADLSGRETAYLRLLKQTCPQIAEAQRLLTTFSSLVTQQASGQFECWLGQCERSSIPEFVRFAKGLRRDEAAVDAALRYPWSQGPVEGQINRLKLLKRQMYGRAGFALLRRRMLAQAAPPP
jgi:transposase